MEAKRWYVYVVANRANGKVYVGKAWSPSARWRHHLYQARAGHQTSLHRAIRKYGAGAFSVEVQVGCMVEEDAFALEREFVARLRSNDGRFGYNRTAGGDGTTGAFVTGTTRAKQRAAKVGRPLSESHRGRISQATRMWKDRTPSPPMSINQAFLMSGWGLVLWKGRAGRRDACGVPAVAAALRRALSYPWRCVLMAAMKKGKPRDPDASRRAGESNRGKVRTPEHIENYRRAQARRFAR